MTVGAFVRKLAGPLERPLCAAYRAVFINVRRCTDQIAGAIPEGSTVIDVGGGDGELLNHLLMQRPDIHVVMLDLRAEIGIFLDPSVRHRVTLRPSTSLRMFRDQGERADVLLVSDVVHHVPAGARVDFVQDCLGLLRPAGKLIIKDVAPGGFISMLSVLADRYITGDRHVELMEPQALVALVEAHGAYKSQGWVLADSERPNYAVLFAESRV